MPHAVHVDCAHAMHVVMLVFSHIQPLALRALLACPCVCKICLPLRLCVFDLSETLV